MTYDCMTVDSRGRTQEAKRMLQQVRLFDIHINSKLEELDKLKALTMKITTTIKPDVVSSGGNQDKIGDAVAKIVDLQDEINQAVDDYIDRKKMVNAEQMALHELIAAATCSGATNNVNNLTRICQVGFPGG